MAANFLTNFFTSAAGSFLAGASKQYVKQDEADKQEARRIAAEVREQETWDKRFEKQQSAINARTSNEKRKSSQKSVEEMLGAFKALGLGDELAGQLAAQGKGAFAIHVDQIKRANELGVDYNTIWKLSPSTGQSGAIEEAISTIQPPKVNVTGSLEAASGADPTPTVSITPEQEDIFNAAGVNIDVIQQLYKPLPKIESAYSARLAVLSQKRIRTKDQSEINALEVERKQLLQDYKEFKAADRAEEGEDTPSFGVGTIASNISAFTRVVAPTYGFGVVDSGLGVALDTTTMNEGNEHLFDIANLRVSEMLNDLNKDFNDPNMLNTIMSMQNTSNVSLNEYVNGVVSDDKRKASSVTEVSAIDFAAAAEKNQYRPGQILQVINPNDNSIQYIVYTGVTDFKTNMNFLVVDR